MKKHTLILTLSILYIFMPLWQVLAVDSLAQGETLFRQNKPLEALPFLEEAILVDTALPAAYNYLGLTYTQLRQFDKAIETFIKGIDVPNADTALLYFNAGNAAFSAGNFPRAVELYTFSFDSNNAYAKAILNRANAYLRQLSLKPAYDDYSLYLVLEPTTEQRLQIEQLLAILETDIMSQEMLKIAQQAQQEAINQQIENQKKLQELQAQAAAQAQKAQEEEQKRLLAEEQQRLEEARREALRLETERIQRENEALAQKALEEEAARLAAEEQRRAEQEAARIAAEEQRRAEQERIAAARAEAEAAEQRRIEQEAQAEAARIASDQAQRDLERKRLLEEISSALQSSDSENISAGAGGAFGYEYEPTID